ncbi:MAG: Hsp20/alpha crystallin family protein [Phenylobacterium sp.]|uniref:Hsp20/alpha crystallin family protein n=1 Tax=Phenylobacterium sp. TaxID=1871053 RepID=UPI001A1BCA2C|nr:Hsp20/alpha crystallin family protein [Phenylobacterium sp.]MBJ7409392.1 Hsp20/alpha crystallin family protein [Phenylobacterium sp.]
MANRNSRDWMWSEAVQMLARADRLHRQVFRPAGAARTPAWEPPIDLLETAGDVQIIAALPGVDPSGVQVFIDGDALVITGRRNPAPCMRRAVIHHMELPQGQFARRVPLPAGHYGRIDWQAEHGCLTVTLRKAGQNR